MTETRVAYALREPYQGTVTVDDDERPRYLGGVVSVGDADLDLRAALDADPHPGVIVVDTASGDGNLAAAVLDERPELKRVTLPDVAELDATAPLEGLSFTDLRARARAEGLAGAGTKDELVRALAAAARVRAEGGDPSGRTVTDLAGGTTPTEEA